MGYNFTFFLSMILFIFACCPIDTMEVRPSFHFIDVEFKQTDNNFWMKMTRITEFVQKSQFRSMRIARSKNEINIVGM